MQSQWTEEESTQIGQALISLGELYRTEMAEGLTKMYLRVLEPYPATEVIRAMEGAIQTCRYFPKPVDLIDLINGPPGERAVESWTALQDAIRHYGKYKSIFFEDGRTSALIEYFGGWVEICSSWRDSELQFRRDEFIKA